MVKITSPLMSQTAQGTLGGSLTFRRSKRGTILTRKQRQPRQLTPALKANTILIPFCHKILHDWDLLFYQEWHDIAKRDGISPTNAVIRYQARAFWNNTPFRQRPDESYTGPAPPPPSITAYLSSEPDGVTIQTYGISDFEMIAFFRTYDGDTTFNPTTLIGIPDPRAEFFKAEDRPRLHGNAFYHAYAWYLDSERSEPSEAAYVWIY